MAEATAAAGVVADTTYSMLDGCALREIAQLVFSFSLSTTAGKKKERRS